MDRPSRGFSLKPLAQLARSDTELESLAAVHEQDRDLQTVAALQYGIGGNVDLLQPVRNLPSYLRRDRLHLFAKVALRTAVKREGQHRG